MNPLELYEHLLKLDQIALQNCEASQFVMRVNLLATQEAYEAAMAYVKEQMKAMAKEPQ